MNLPSSPSKPERPISSQRDAQAFTPGTEQQLDSYQMPFIDRSYSARDSSAKGLSRHKSALS